QKAGPLFEVWKEKHGVAYATPKEELKRLTIFTETVERIVHHNSGRTAADGSEDHMLGLNKFSDMSWEEFQSSHLGFNGVLRQGQNCSATHHPGQFREAVGNSFVPPASRDWRLVGAVSEVKDQSHCGSCWTFSATGCLESHHFLRTGDMVLLSEQQLVDCAQDFDNHGCNGGLPSHAFQYTAAAGGLDTEKAYPYVGHESGSCSFVPSGVGAEVLRSVNITFQDEAELLEAVGTIGPVSIAFEV
ncbi:unnamed protein product, partial [Discosporangium mesarthrocarpum]